MTLDARPTDAQLLELKAEREGKRVNGVALGPDSPLHKTRKRSTKAERDAARLAARIAHVDDAIDPAGRMNKTERARAELLEHKRRAGLILSWKFEAVALVLGDRCRYHPDFLIRERDRSFTLEEVKGRWYDDARVKIKAAARQFPEFQFIAIRKRRKKEGGGWDMEAISP